MKNIIAFLLVASVVLAQPIAPMPIPVKVLTYGYAGGIPIVVANERTGETGTSATDQNGEAVIEWANSALKYNYGDKFTVKVGPQTKIVYAPDVPILTFDFTGVCPAVTCPTPQAVPTPTITPTPVPVDCSKECQPSDPFAQAVAYIITFIIGAGAGGYGLKLYRKTSGAAGVLHKHRGIKDYHDPNTLHSNVKYRHKKGELNPKYDSEGNYQG